MLERYWIDNDGEIDCPGDSCNYECTEGCPIWLNTLAEALISIERYDEAIIKLHKSIEIEPEFAEAYNNLSSCYGCLSLYTKSLKYSEAAMKLDESSAAAMRNYITSLKNLYFFEKALEYCDIYEQEFGSGSFFIDEIRSKINYATAGLEKAENLLLMFEETGIKEGITAPVDNLVPEFLLTNGMSLIEGLDYELDKIYNGYQYGDRKLEDLALRCGLAGFLFSSLFGTDVDLESNVSIDLYDMFSKKTDLSKLDIWVCEQLNVSQDSKLYTLIRNGFTSCLPYLAFRNYNCREEFKLLCTRECFKAIFIYGYLLSGNIDQLKKDAEKHFDSKNIKNLIGVKTSADILTERNYRHYFKGRLTECNPGTDKNSGDTSSPDFNKLEGVIPDDCWIKRIRYSNSCKSAYFVILSLNDDYTISDSYCFMETIDISYSTSIFTVSGTNEVIYIETPTLIPEIRQEIKELAKGKTISSEDNSEKPSSDDSKATFLSSKDDINYFADVLKDFEVYTNYNKEQIKSAETILSKTLNTLNKNFLLSCNYAMPLKKYPIEQVDVICETIKKDYLEYNKYSKVLYTFGKDTGHTEVSIILDLCAYAGLGAYRLCSNNKDGIDIYSELMSPKGVDYINESASHLNGIEFDTDKYYYYSSIISAINSACFHEFERIANDYDNLQDNTLAMQFYECMRALYLIAAFFERDIIEIETEIEKEKQIFGNMLADHYIKEGINAETEGKIKEAVLFFRKASMAAPELAAPYKHLSKIYFHKAEEYFWEDFISYTVVVQSELYWCELAANLDPDDLELLKQLAFAYFNDCDEERAIITCKKFIVKGGDISEVEEILNDILYC